MHRRGFLQTSAYAALGSLIPWPGHPALAQSPAPYRLALNQWSLWQDYVGDTSAEGWWSEFMTLLDTAPARILKGPRDPMDFPRVAREEFGLDAVELEASLYYAKLGDRGYFERLRQACADQGVQVLLLSNVWAGNLASVDGMPRAKAEKYFPWVDLCKVLDCPLLMVNVNARRGDKPQLRDAAIEGLCALVDYAQPSGVSIVFENHNWFSADADWLIEIVEGVDSPWCGLNVDFGNFCERGWHQGTCRQPIDPYTSIEKLMPHAKSLSAKSFRFDERGNETWLDYRRILATVRASGYTGHFGIEYSGNEHSSREGVRKTIELIRKTGWVV